MTSESGQIMDTPYRVSPIIPDDEALHLQRGCVSTAFTRIDMPQAEALSQLQELCALPVQTWFNQAWRRCGMHIGGDTH